MNRQQEKLVSILKHEKFSLIENPDFDVTKNQIVFEKNVKALNTTLRVILDTEGEDNDCSVTVYGLDNWYLSKPLLWEANFGFNIPTQSICHFFRTFQ